MVCLGPFRTNTPKRCPFHYRGLEYKSRKKPTIGILLCKEKKDTLVRLTLPEDANIYASAYELYLPDKKLLQAKVKEWVNEFENAR